MHIGLKLLLWITLLGFGTLFGCSPVIFSSSMPGKAAIYENQPPDVYKEIQSELTVVKVRYYSTDGRMHQGQVVIHRLLADDIREVFRVIKKTRFPVESVLPIAHAEIQKKGPYGLSPDTNNSSAYVWRPMVGTKKRKLSLHSLGLAFDINPRMNPYIKGKLILPPGAKYDPYNPQTLTPDSPVVKTFKLLGWKWGGDWKNGKVDYMHFQKIPVELKSWVRLYRK